MQTSLVTGGAGFLGSHVVKELLSFGKGRVVVLDDLSEGFEKNVPAGAEFVRGSVVDEAGVDRLFKVYSFDYVYHLAAYAAENLSHYVRRFNYESNLIGSVNLINASVRYCVRCFVFTSSAAVYGDSGDLLTEDDVPRPADPYGISKLAVELDLAAAGRRFGLPYVVFRPHNVYGERQNLADSARNVVGIFMNQILRGEPMTVFGDGSQSRAFSYVGDVAPYLAVAPQVLAAIGQTFNVGSNDILSVNELARLVAEVMGRPSYPTVYLPARGEARSVRPSHARLCSVFGEGRQTSLRDGLTRMARWAAGVGGSEPKPPIPLEIARTIR